MPDLHLGSGMSGFEASARVSRLTSTTDAVAAGTNLHLTR